MPSALTRTAFLLGEERVRGLIRVEGLIKKINRQTGDLLERGGLLGRGGLLELLRYIISRLLAQIAIKNVFKVCLKLTTGIPD